MNQDTFVRNFDLRSLNERYFAIRRVERLTGLAVCLAVAAIIGVFVGTAISQVSSSIARVTPVGVVWLVAIGAATIMVALGVYLFRVASPDLSKLLVDQTGVTMTFRGGRSTRVEWKDPKLHLTIQDYEGRIPATWKTPVSTRFLTRPRGPMSALTPEAVEGILAMAKREGVTITTYLGSGAFGPAPMIWDIHGSSIRGKARLHRRPSE